jgi:hypothetical protein
MEEELKGEEILNIDIVDPNDTLERGQYWAVTWPGPIGGLKVTDLNAIYVKLMHFRNVENFVLQMDISDGELYIHAVITFKTRFVRPVSEFKKQFPGLRMNKAKKYKLWQSFVTKNYSRAPGTETMYYGVNPRSIKPYTKNIEQIIVGNPTALTREREDKRRQRNEEVETRKRIEKEHREEISTISSIAKDYDDAKEAAGALVDFLCPGKNLEVLLVEMTGLKEQKEILEKDKEFSEKVLEETLNLLKDNEDTQKRLIANFEIINNPRNNKIKEYERLIENKSKEIKRQEEVIRKANQKERMEKLEHEYYIKFCDKVRKERRERGIVAGRSTLARTMSAEEREREYPKAEFRQNETYQEYLNVCRDEGLLDEYTQQDKSSTSSSKTFSFSTESLSEEKNLPLVTYSSSRSCISSSLSKTESFSEEKNLPLVTYSSSRSSISSLRTLSPPTRSLDEDLPIKCTQRDKSSTSSSITLGSSTRSPDEPSPIEYIRQDKCSTYSSRNKSSSTRSLGEDLSVKYTQQNKSSSSSSGTKSSSIENSVPQSTGEIQDDEKLEEVEVELEGYRAERRILREKIENCHQSVIKENKAELSRIDKTISLLNIEVIAYRLLCLEKGKSKENTTEGKISLKQQRYNFLFDRLLCLYEIMNDVDAEYREHENESKAKLPLTRNAALDGMEKCSDKLNASSKIRQELEKEKDMLDEQLYPVRKGRTASKQKEKSLPPTKENDRISPKIKIVRDRR